MSMKNECAWRATRDLALYLGGGSLLACAIVAGMWVMSKASPWVFLGLIVLGLCVFMWSMLYAQAKRQWRKCADCGEMYDRSDGKGSYGVCGRCLDAGVAKK